MRNSQVRKFQNLDSLRQRGVPRSRHVQQKGVWCAQSARTASALGGYSSCIPWAVDEPAQFEFLLCVITLIMAWQLCLVSAVDSSTIVQLLVLLQALSYTLFWLPLPWVLWQECARPVKNRMPAGTKTTALRQSAQHQQSEVQAEHHPDVPSSTPGCSKIGSGNIHVLAGGVEDE